MTSVRRLIRNVVAGGLVSLSLLRSFAQTPGKTSSNNAESLIAVVASPEKFASKEVVVKGYLVVQRDLLMLFVSEESAREHILKNGVWLNIERLSQADRAQILNVPAAGFATLKGVVVADHQGPNDLLACELALTALHNLPPRK